MDGPDIFVLHALQARHIGGALMPEGVMRGLYWHCLRCGDHEPVEPTGGAEEYTVGDSEKCIACGEGMAHVVTLTQGAAYEQGRAMGMSVDSAWKRAKGLLP